MWSDDDEYFSYTPHYYGSNDDIIDSDDDLDFSFNDDDDYCHSVGSDEESMLYPAVLISKSGHWEVKKHENTGSSEAVSSPVYQVKSLVDSCSRFIAVSFPFAYLEHRCPPIPDELQMKVIKFSFPEDEEMIRKYAEFSRSNVDFGYASRLHQNGSVKNLNQIGFRLSSKVEDRRNPGRRGNNEGYYVTIHFDRGKITSAHCSCDLNSNWCEHAIATCLARINDSEKMMVHLPVSDSLNLLNREQLLKFTQYLLCEHQNEQVVDSAQQLLDRLLLRQQKGKEDDINSIAGAPDPTAGPGLDEESHWFVCKSGFKSRCESLVYESWEDLGFVMYRHTDNDRASSVHEAWKRNIFRPALIRDEMDQELDHGFSSERQRHSVLQVLETTEDLLQDDYMSAFAALSMCTEQLIERLNKLCCKKSTRDRFLLSPGRKQQNVQNDVVKVGGSLAGGFTPRISSCRTLIDELSRLWRLAVISPRVPAKQRPGITNRLMSFTEEAAKAFSYDTLQLEPWQGVEVALRLSRVNWSTLQFQRVLRGEWVHFPVVSSLMAIHLDYQWNSVDLAHEGMEVEEPKDASSGMEPRTTELAMLYNPHCISVDPCCNIDIHSLCSMIEALRANTNHKPAIRLAVAVSCGLVSYYKSLLCGDRDVDAIPVSAKCFLGQKRGNTSVPQAECSEAAMEIDKGCKETNSTHVWPEDTLLSITTFAFLFDVLSLESDLVDACLVEMKAKLGLVSLSEQQQLGVDCLCSAQSLRFQLGVHGLFMHRLPAPSQHGEVEQFETECWLTYRLIGCSPGQNDLTLLTQLGRHVISKSRTLPGVPPPYSLARVIVYHLFKCAPAGLCKSLTKEQTLGLSVAFFVLAYDNMIVKEGVNMAWMMFQYANLRLCAKLANVVLHSVADSEEFLEKAMNCILKPNGIVGLPSAEELSMRSCRRELFDAKGRVLFSLARSLSGKRMDLAETTRVELKRKNAQCSRNFRRSASKECEVVEAETPRKIMKSGVEKALNLCAVRIGAHSVWLQSGANRRYSQGETVRWLMEFAVNSGIDCVISLTKFEGGIHALLKQTEVLDLCDRVLKKGEKQSQNIVQEILLSQLQKSSQSESSEEMKAVISFCRENRCASKLDLLPWICRELQSFKDKGSFLSFDVLMHASQAMFLHYRERLDTAENHKRHWPQDGPLCLERLFNPGVPQGDDSDKEEEIRLSQNPYRLPEAHPFLETAFDLGMSGLEKLKDKSEDLYHERLPYYGCPAREHLEKFCKLVCYLVEKKWLTSILSESPKLYLTRKDDQSKPTAKPGCSKWDDDCLQSVSRVPHDNCYLPKFVCCLINCVDNPLWLFSALRVLGDYLHIKGERYCAGAVARQEQENLQMKEACQSYLSIKLLQQKVLDAFSKLLLGPKMAELVEDITNRLIVGELEASDVLHEFSHSCLLNTRLREVLRVAKRAFNLLDSSGSFMSLVSQISSQHSVMESFLDLVMKDKEFETEDREIIMYPRGNVRLTDFVAHRLFPGLFAGSPINDFFYS